MSNNSKKKRFNNSKFIDSALMNDATFYDYLDRLKKVALSMFEWINLPSSMNARYLEMCLYYKGQAALLYDNTYGFINTQCSSAGYINIYGLPSKLNCYSFEYQSMRRNYVGLNDYNNDKEDDECILVMNNYDLTPTATSIELFALRLYEAERTIDVNVKSQKTPIMIVVDDTQRLLMENLYNQYNGNQPFIFGDKNQLQGDMIKAIKTEAPFIVDKMTTYKKEILNEALTFLGINSLMVEKNERLTESEANSNNEYINLNLQSYLIPRKEACRLFNEKFGLIGTNKAIDIRVRSDLHNVIKEVESIVNDYVDNTLKTTIEEGVENG